MESAVAECKLRSTSMYVNQRRLHILFRGSITTINTLSLSPDKVVTIIFV